MGRNKKIELYLSEVFAEEDLLFKIWKSLSMRGRRQEIFRRALLTGLVSMIKNGDIPDLFELGIGDGILGRNAVALVQNGLIKDVKSVAPKKSSRRNPVVTSPNPSGAPRKLEPQVVDAIKVSVPAPNPEPLPIVEKTSSVNQQPQPVEIQEKIASETKSSGRMGRLM